MPVLPPEATSSGEMELLHILKVDYATFALRIRATCMDLNPVGAGLTEDPGTYR